MEETSGQNLQWFFDQWVYGAGAPRLDIQQNYNTRTKTLSLTIGQTQTVDAITPAVFRLPLDITIKIASGDAMRKIEITKRVQTFSFKSAKPDDLIIDQDEKIPLKRVKLRPIIMVR